DDAEIDVEPAGQRTDGGRRAHDRAAAPLRRGRRVARDLGAGLDAADDRARVARGARRARRVGVAGVDELDERVADLKDVAGLDEQAADPSGSWARDLDDGLLGLDRKERLVDVDVVVLADVPRADFRFLEAFAEIRQREDLHAASRVSCTAATI